MNHISIAAENSPRTDIKRRLSGQFYTPMEVCEALVKQVAESNLQPKTVADPFCGDGRFVLTWLRHMSANRREHLGKLERILLWDCDADAVMAAQKSVNEALKDLDLRQCAIDAKVLDTFTYVGEAAKSVDLILTNPPWELLKLDSRDLIDHEAAPEYRAELKRYSEQLARSLPGAASQKRKVMGGASVNLARAGAVACVTLLSPSSLMGIVLPASIFADQASAPFRREFFQNVSVQKMQYFPAELRTFDGVDQPFVTLTCIGCKMTEQFSLETFGIAVHDGARIISNDASGVRPIPLVISSSQAEIIERLEKEHAALRMLEYDMRFGLWLGRELDETRISESFGETGVPFLKGRQVDRFSIRKHTPPLISPRNRDIPSTTHEQRLAWRDVSRPNQKRRVQATVIPKNWVTGNSLGIGYFRYAGRTQLLALLGILNSLVFELQLRAKLHTPHVSLGVVRECLVPWAVFEDPKLLYPIAESVEALLDAHSFQLEAALERRVANAYGLVEEQFAELLKAFPKLSALERKLLSSEDS